MKRLSLVSLLLLSAAWLRAADQEPSIRIYVWVEAALLQDPRLKPALTALGAHGVALEAGADPTPVLKASLPFYLDQLVPKGVLLLDEESFQASVRTGMSTGEWIRPVCLRDPATTSAVLANMERTKSQLQGARPDFISLRDEPSATRFINPADFCTCTACAAAFVPWLQARHGGSGAAQIAWGLPARGAVEQSDVPTRFSFMTTETARRRLFHDRETPVNLTPWNDARSFADTSYANTLKEWMDAARKTFPSIPVGWLGGQMPSAFGGYDWPRLLRDVDVVEAYDVLGTRELVHSFRRRETSTVTTLFAAADKVRTAIHELYHAVINGDTRIVLYSAKSILGPNPEQPLNAWGTAIAPHLRQIQSEAMRHFRSAAVPDAPVFILHDMNSVRADWMLSIRTDGRTWPKRLGSYEGIESPQGRARAAWSAVFEDLGVRYQYITPAAIEAGALRTSSCRAVVLARTVAMSNATAQSLRDFHRRGGLVLADAATGLFDEHLRLRSSAALDDLFHLEGRQTDVAIHQSHFDGGLPYALAERGLRASTKADAKDAAGTHYLIQDPARERDGSSGTLYANLDIGAYALARFNDPARAEWLTSRVAAALRRAGVVQRFPVTVLESDSRWPIAVEERIQGDATFLALSLAVPPLNEGVPPKDLLRPEKLRLRVALREPRSLQDLSKGGDLGRCANWEVELTGDTPALFCLKF